MTPVDAELEREGRALLRYIRGREPSADAVAAYVRAHAALPLAPHSRFERALLKLAVASSAGAFVVDSYTSVVGADTVRQKLVLALAIDEASRGGAERVQSLAEWAVRAGSRLLLHGGVVVTVAPWLHVLQHLERWWERNRDAA